MSGARSITEAQRRPATYADVIAVVNTASAMIAALEARIVLLEAALAQRTLEEQATEAKPE